MITLCRRLGIALSAENERLIKTRFIEEHKRGTNGAVIVCLHHNISDLAGEDGLYPFISDSLVMVAAFESTTGRYVHECTSNGLDEPELIIDENSPDPLCLADNEDNPNYRDHHHFPDSDVQIGPCCVCLSLNHRYSEAIAQASSQLFNESTSPSEVPSILGYHEREYSIEPSPPKRRRTNDNMPRAAASSISNTIINSPELSASSNDGNLTSFADSQSSHDLSSLNRNHNRDCHYNNNHSPYHNDNDADNDNLNDVWFQRYLSLVQQVDDTVPYRRSLNLHRARSRRRIINDPLYLKQAVSYLQQQLSDQKKHIKVLSRKANQRLSSRQYSELKHKINSATAQLLELQSCVREWAPSPTLNRNSSTSSITNRIRRVLFVYIFSNECLYRSFNGILDV